MQAVSLSYLLACFVDRDSGLPSLGPRRVAHVVRVGPDTAMPVVLEFSDGGRFEHEDCAPASMFSRCRQQGIPATILEIETLAGTNLNGTGFPGCLRALHHYGIPAVQKVGNPPPGLIMNPMLDVLVPLSEFPKYVAASQNGYIAMGAYVPPPPPPGPPPKELEMQTLVIEPTAVDPALVPGVTGSTTLNIAAFKPCTFTMFLWTPTGGTVAARTVTLAGNQPGKVGPVEFAGYLYQLFAVPPSTPGGSGPAKPGVPYLLGLFPGSSPYSASLY